MRESIPGRTMLALWAGVLVAPVVWSISLASMLWLTHPVCQGASHSVLWLTGGICALVVFGALIGATVGLARAGSKPDRTEIVPFMLKLAVGASALFALVILLSMAPIALLTPCPL